MEEMSIQKMCLQCSFHSLYLGINLNFECSPPPKLIWPPQKNGLLGGGEKVLGGGEKSKNFSRFARNFTTLYVLGGFAPP